MNDAKHACPFYVTYKWSDDQEEYFLQCYDEMHNHILQVDSGIIPYQRKSLMKPSFQTPMFFRFQTYKVNSFEEFKNQVIQTARERSFNVDFQGEFSNKNECDAVYN